MKQHILPDFIVIDDDVINNMICHKIIELTIPGAVVKTFIKPEKGLEYIARTYSDNGAKDAVVFLDINMPSINGWEVLDRLNHFPEHVKDRVKIFMLSSSVDPNEKDKANNNQLVSGYLTKSISKAKLEALFPDYIKQEGDHFEVESEL